MGTVIRAALTDCPARRAEMKAPWGMTISSPEAQKVRAAISMMSTLPFPRTTPSMGQSNLEAMALRRA